jgi:hypothetical protein
MNLADNYAKPAGMYIGVQLTLSRKTSQDNLPCLPDCTPCIDEIEPGSRFVYESMLPQNRVPVVILKALVVQPDLQKEAPKKSKGILPGIKAQNIEDLIDAFMQWGERHNLKCSRKSVRFYSIYD